MKKDHRGFTLAELLVVVAILGVCAAIVTLSLSTASSAQANKCASEIDALLSQAKISAMSEAGPCYLLLETQENGTISAKLVSQAGVRQETVGGSRVLLSYKVGDAEVQLADAPLYIAFNRETGSLLPPKDAAALASADSAAIPAGDLTAITATKGRSYVITIVPVTGYHGIGG